MALPHLCHQPRYQDFFQTRNKDEWIILDNGAAEDVTFGAKHLHTLADLIGAKEIVVPDTLFEFRETLGQALQFGQIADPKFRYMAVLQGRTMQEFQKCLEAYMVMPILQYITTIGVPRLMDTAIGEGARVGFMEWVQGQGLDAVLEYHCLGGTSDLAEVEFLADIPAVRGIDTSAPVYMGLEGRSLTDEYFSRPADFFDRYKLEHEEVLDQNIRTYLEWAQYEYNPPSS